MIRIICFKWCSAVIRVNHSIFLAKLLLLLDVCWTITTSIANRASFIYIYIYIKCLFEKVFLVSISFFFFLLNLI
jgi:hypothetical protein